MSTLIGDVTCTPHAPVAGQSFKIEVSDPSGRPYEPQGSTVIHVNGMPGNQIYLQFPVEGSYKIPITAKGPDGSSDRSDITIAVGPPVLSAATQKALADPAAANLPAAQIAYLKATADVSLLTIAPKAPYGAPFAVSFNLHGLAKFFKPPVSVDAKNGTAFATAKGVSPPAQAPIEPQASRWTWDFGDGSEKATTNVPNADHDYAKSLGSTQEFHQFNVSVSQDTQGSGSDSAGSSSGSWTRTLIVHNPYVAIKKRNYLILAVESQGWATKDGENYVASAEIKNIEPAPITLHSRLVVPVLADSGILTTPTSLEPLASPIVVPANGSIATKVSVPFAKVPKNAVGFKVIFADDTVTIEADKTTSTVDAHGVQSSNRDLKVRATAHFLLHPAVSGRPILEVHKDDKGKPSPDAPSSDQAVKQGNPCDPDNLPSDAPPTLACQITPKMKRVLIPAQFLNAAKGDVVLCPSVGDASLVDAMFGYLDTPQLYGHSGIMTRNYDQITHCTASESRLINYTVSGLLGGGDEGFDPDALKYAWPGTITETVDQAVNGQMITDPASSKGTQYNFQSFSGTSSDIQLKDSWVLIPPLVVKPDPVLETYAVRKLLNDVADDAYSNTGKYHYRFYAFTDPAGNLAAPSSGLSTSSTWAQKTDGAVCSSFVWKMMKGRGVHAMGPSQYVTEAELGEEAKNLHQLLDPNGKTPDGLFYYTEAERQVCGQWLYNTVWNQADAQAGWLGEALTHAADYYATELLNSFAVDDSSTEDNSTAWQSPGNANAISPNDYLGWNGPDKGGVLGYSEPLIYAPANYATVHLYEWAEVTAYGKLAGKVTLDGKPAEHVTLTIPGLSGFSVGSDKNGNYTFERIPYGPYSIVAKQAETKGPVDFGVQTGTMIYDTGEVSVKVDRGLVTAPEIKLRAPNTPYIRSMVITGHVSLDCSVWDWGSNHYDYYGPIGQATVDIGNGHPTDSWSTNTAVHSANVQFYATFNYQKDDSVDVFFKAVLDGQYERAYTTTIAAGDSYTFTIGDSNSFLNGRAGYTYDGYPDLEGNNDTMCCGITFQNKEWSA